MIIGIATKFCSKDKGIGLTFPNLISFLSEKLKAESKKLFMSGKLKA